MLRYVRGDPYNWPYDGQLRPDNTAFVIIDMQVDFCGKGGYVDQMGYDLQLTRAPIEPIKRVLAACRQHGYTVIHTREGHRPEESDLPANKKWRSEQIGAGIGSCGPCGRVLIRGEPGWEIIEELAPVAGEPVIDKAGKGSFYATDLELVLRTRGIRNIILSGITTDVCVHTTMRDANDRGFECLLLSDCTGATDYGNYAAAINMVKMQGGVFGSVATSDDLLATISRHTAPHQPPAGPTATIAAKPYEYTAPLQQCALLMIDFQRDFLEEGGFGAALGNDVARLKACVPAAQQLLAACRAAGLEVVHTLEAHKPDLSDLHSSKLQRGRLPEGLRIGDCGSMGRILVAGERGNGIVDELAPVEGEKLVHKPGKGAFYATGLEGYLKSRGITHLLFAGVTTEVCVQTSMREANDRGFECLLVTDATESYFPQFKQVVVEMVHAQGGIVGWTADTAAVTAALTAAAASC